MSHGLNLVHPATLNLGRAARAPHIRRNAVSSSWRISSIHRSLRGDLWRIRSSLAVLAIILSSARRCFRAARDSLRARNHDAVSRRTGRRPYCRHAGRLARVARGLRGGRGLHGNRFACGERILATRRGRAGACCKSRSDHDARRCTCPQHRKTTQPPWFRVRLGARLRVSRFHRRHPHSGATRGLFRARTRRVDACRAAGWGGSRRRIGAGEPSRTAVRAGQQTLSLWRHARAAQNCPVPARSSCCGADLRQSRHA